MAGVDVEAIARPLSEEAPCGPDLDAVGDLDYMNLMARIEGDLPASYFSFDRGSIDFKADTAALAALLERSLDLRPVVVLAKLGILDRDLDSFTGWVSASHTLLSRFWAEVHPSVADDQAALRAAVLQTLDDLPTVILPLQYAPLASGRRTGSISFRHHLVASGEVARREGEAEMDAGAIEQGLMEAEIADLIAVRDRLAQLVAAVEGIRKTWITHGGFDDAPTLERLTKLSRRMLDFIEDAVSRRAPQAAMTLAAAAPGAEAEEAAPPQVAALPGAGGAAFRVDSAAAASQAFAAVVSYLADHEPSNPALLLVCQAQQLVGRSFVEIMRLIMPDAIKEARIAVGVEQQFVFKLEQLPEISFAQDEPGEGAEGPAPDGPVASSRRDVQALLDQIAAFYKSAEPSNPIPLLCERARGMCSLDFASLLKDMLPKKK